MLQYIKLQIITIIYTGIYLKFVDIWRATYQKLYIKFTIRSFCKLRYVYSSTQIKSLLRVPLNSIHVEYLSRVQFCGFFASCLFCRLWWKPISGYLVIGIVVYLIFEFSLFLISFILCYWSLVSNQVTRRASLRFVMLSVKSLRLTHFPKALTQDPITDANF